MKGLLPTNPHSLGRKSQTLCNVAQISAKLIYSACKGMTVLNSSLLLALGQPSQHLSHGLSSICSSSTSPYTASSDRLSCLSWQLHTMPVGKGTKHFHFWSIKIYFIIPLFRHSVILYSGSQLPVDRDATVETIQGVARS